MAISLTSAARWALQFPKTAMLAARLFLDTRVSPMLKIGAAAAAVAVVSPIDIFGDVPLLGPIDDIALLMLLATLFVRLCPSAIVREHQGTVGVDPPVSQPGAPFGTQQIKNVTPKP